MSKKNIIILVIASFITMFIVGVEVYFWKKTSVLDFNSKQEGINFCNYQIPLDQKEECLTGIEARFK